MGQLATDIAAIYKNENRRASLDDLFRLELVRKHYAAARADLKQLRHFNRDASPQVRANDIPYEIVARAGGSPAFAAAFREVVRPLDDRTAALVARALTLVDPATLKASFGAELRREGPLSLPDALTLVRAYLAWQTLASIQPVAAAAIEEDDRHRYVVAKNVLVQMPDGARICAMVVRPRSLKSPAPTLLNFTIYADPATLMSEARRTASNGYVGVEGMTRGKGCSPDAAVPYEHDGEDAAALIDWISRQIWSDGRVGMYGGSYEGFTQWATAKHMPKALKALMPAVTAAPGIDVPMEGNITQNWVYYWPFYVTNSKSLDNDALNDRARWNRLDRSWYLSGKAYRSLDTIDGAPNPFFDRWLDHPNYDAYWQAMIPYGEEFSKIDIPVLTTDGYYDTGQIGGLYYVLQSERYNPAAEHYLLIGPYDHVSGQRGTLGLLGTPRTSLDGYALDPAAQIDMGELRYQWFDYVLKGGAKPALLQDKINYEVMGADAWMHVPSIAAMADHTTRFHLSATRSENGFTLSDRDSAVETEARLIVDLADRADADRVSPVQGIVDKHLDTWNGIAFVSDAFSKVTDVSGLFSGHLVFTTNKQDFDFLIQLYELTPQSDYVALSHYMARASYVDDRTTRHLLRPGAAETLNFKSQYLTSRRFQVGSRLVITLSVVRQPDTQINYGTGKNVSDETIADAAAPLEINWSSSSFIDIPIGKMASD